MLNALHMGWVEYCAALATARRMAADMDGRTLVVHNGDVSYAEGFVYGWDVFMHMMAPIIQRAPYMLTPGEPSHMPSNRNTVRQGLEHSCQHVGF